MGIRKKKYLCQNKVFTKLLSKLKFSTKIENFHQNWNFSPKLKSFTKIVIFHQNWNIWPKLKFFTQIENFHQNGNFSPKLKFLTKSEIFDQNWNCWPKLRLFTKIVFTKLLGYEHQHWQNRNVRTKIHLPYNSDFSQGELVQEKLVYDYGGTRKAPFTARAVPMRNRVPLIIAPPLDQLRNSKLKPYISSAASDRHSWK